MKGCYLCPAAFRLNLKNGDKEKRNDRLSDDESMKACLEKID